MSPQLTLGSISSNVLCFSDCRHLQAARVQSCLSVHTLYSLASGWHSSQVRHFSGQYVGCMWTCYWACIITIEDLVKFSKGGDKFITCFIVSRQFLTLKWQITDSVTLTEPPLPSCATGKLWLVWVHTASCVVEQLFRTGSIGPVIGTPSIHFWLNHKNTALSCCTSLPSFMIFAFFCIPMSDISRWKVRIFSLFFLISEIVLLPTLYFSAMTLLELTSSCFIMLILSSIVRTFLFRFALNVEVQVSRGTSILPT